MLRPTPHHPSDALLQRDKPVRLSRYFMPVLKETPGEAQVISHQLMLRAPAGEDGGIGLSPPRDAAEARKQLGW